MYHCVSAERQRSGPLAVGFRFIGTPESRHAITRGRKKDQRDWRFSVNWPEFDSFDWLGQLANEASVFQTPVINYTYSKERCDGFGLETYLQVCRWNRLLRRRLWEYYIGLQSLFVSS
jgi:hypothetical protein